MDRIKEYYPNQIITGNDIYEALKTDSSDVVRLVAEMQTGKTGAVLFALTKFSQHARDTSKDVKYFFVGPSDLGLKNQTRDRVAPLEWVNPKLLRGDIYHMPDIIESSNLSSAVKNEIKQHLETGGTLVVIWDEAHVGIGKGKKRDSNGLREDQVIPKFLREVASLPGITENKNVKHIMITATPFSQDHFMSICREAFLDPKITTFYLDPGENYVGIVDMLEAGRIKESFGPFRRNEKQLFLDKFVSLLEKWKGDDPTYGVVRSTISYQIAWYEEACNLAGVKYTAFRSAQNNISLFAERLNEQHHVHELLLIQRSYKQGKTLYKKHIGFWYENKTQSGRNDADVLQSVGRCCGYHDYKTVFPIYMNYDQALLAKEYYSANRQHDIDAAIKKPLSDTHTTRKEKKKLLREIYVGDSYEEVEAVLEKMFGKDIVTVNSQCSKNFGADVMAEGIQSLQDNPRQKTEKDDIIFVMQTLLAPILILKRHGIKHPTYTTNILLFTK